MQSDFVSLVLMEIRARSKHGSAPPILTTEAAAICAVIQRKFAQLEARIPKPCNESYREQPR